MPEPSDPSDRPVITVSETTLADAQVFMDIEWPRHDAGLSIRWDPVAVTLGAKVGPTLVGVAHFVMNGGVCELKQILVVLERARAGIGARLLREVERRARDAGCHKLRLETADYQARPFYERAGFICVCTLKDDRFHHDLHVMEKVLAEG